MRRSSKGFENVDDECQRLKEKRTEITNEIERCRAELDKLTQEIAVSNAFTTDQNEMVPEMQNNSIGVQREYYRPSRQSGTAESVDQIIQPRRSGSDKSANLKLSSFRKSRCEQRVEQPETKKSASTMVAGRKSSSSRDASKLYGMQHRSRFDDHSSAEILHEADYDLRCNRHVRDKENSQPLFRRRSRESRYGDRNSSVDSDRRMNKKHSVCSQMPKPETYESGFRRDGDSSPVGKVRYKDRDYRRFRRQRERSSSSDVSCSHSRADKKSGKNLKPDKFDGTKCLETFLIQFQNCASFNNWSRSECLAHLKWSLSGGAADLLWDADDITYSELVERLRSRYGGKGFEERFQTELKCRKRKKNESLRELAHDIKRLMMLAYPGDRSRMGEHMSCDYFVAALDDPDLELKICEREPETLDAALKIAQRLELVRDSVSQRSHFHSRNMRQVTEVKDQVQLSSIEDRIAKIEKNINMVGETGHVSKTDVANKQNKNGRKNNKQRACAAKVEEDSSWKNQLLQKVQDLETAQHAADVQAKKIAAEKDALQKEVGRLRHLQQLRSVPVATSNDSQQQRQQERSTAADVRTKLCFNCGGPGHFAKNCPCPFRQFVNGRSMQSVELDSLHVSVASELRNHYHSSHNSYLQAMLNGEICECLLDTGSDVCLLPESMVDPRSIRQTTRTLKAANGTPISTLGETTMELRVGDVRTEVTGLVSRHVAEPMIGIDWLTANAVIWDFNKSTIWIGGQSFLLHERTAKKLWCRRVVLQEDVLVPARSEIDVPTQVAFQKLPTSMNDGLWGTEPNLMKPGLHVSRTLIPDDRWSDLPIRVMNVSEQPVVLKSGATVADLQPVEVFYGKMSLSQTSTRGNGGTKLKQIHEEDNVPSFIDELIDRVDDSLPESACLALREILKDHVDVFSQSEYDLGKTNIITHRIDTGDAKPVRQPLRRFPPAHREAISEHVDNMVSQGIIEPASSPWGSNIVLVKKKDGSFRCCIDYRQLNSVTRKDAYPLPHVDTCLDAMSSAAWFSTMDLRQSYHQVPVESKDRDKTAFICHPGMYRYRMMPFGLCNAGATFQRLMDVIMSGLNLNICLIYLDDIITFSKTIEEHLERLVRVFDRLRSAGLKLKPEKCTFFRHSVSFLGHVVSEAGIATDPEKVKAVADWPVPTSLREVRSFLGLASYYRRYVEGFAKIAAPLHALTKKGQVFKWSSEAQASFDALKEALISPPILAMPSDVGEMILDTDASDTSIGSVLSQVQDGVERVIAYASRSLDRRERNYCVSRKELLSVVHFVKYFKQYLLGRRFRLRTDHAPLTWLRSTPEPIGQQGRWLEILEEFDFHIEHRPGIKHGNSDALSRKPCNVKSCACRNEPEVSLSEEMNTNQSMASAYTAGPADRHTSTEIRQINGVAVCQEADDVAFPEGETWSTHGLRSAQNDDPEISCVLNLIQQYTEKPPWNAVALQTHDVKALWHLWCRL